MILFNGRTIGIGILLCFVYSVMSIPRNENTRTAHKKQSVGSVTSNNKTNRHSKNINKDNKYHNTKKENHDGHHLHQRQGDALAGSIEINKENIEGHIDVPNEYINNQKNTKNIPADWQKDASNENVDAITGQLTVNDDSIDGKIVLIDNINTQQAAKDSYSQPNEDAIVGNIEDSNDNAKGEIIFPESLDMQSGLKGSNSQSSDDAVVGHIEVNDGNIQGEIMLPEEFGSQQNTKNSNDHPIEDAIVGYVEENNGNIKGEIALPGNLDIKPSTVDKSPNKNAVIGKIEEKDGNIEGQIVIPQDSNVQPDTEESNIQTNENVVSGKIEVSEDNIQGTINIPNENKIIEGTNNVQDKSDKKNNANNNGDVSGSIEIDSTGNVQGEIKIGEYETKPYDMKPSKHEEDCWMKLNSKKYLKALDELDAKFKSDRIMYQKEIGPNFDKEMMKVLLSSGGAAPRAIHQAHGDPSMIPAGLNLGGFGMMRMRGSMLFFHRMKLRNDTKFNVDFLHTDLMHMTLVSRLTLHDLHLQGAYERSLTQGKYLSHMFFIPNYGELNLLLKDVTYKMEGSLRMLNNRLMIELVSSAINTKEILLTYGNSSSSNILLLKDSIEDFVDRLKWDLDLWLKDYFNDYLMYFGIVGEKSSRVRLYEKQKTIKVNEYADQAIHGIKKRMRDIGAASAELPYFSLVSISNQEVKLKNGVLRGLDSIYRRSVALTKKHKGVRYVDTTIGFSNLKVEYQYEATLMLGQEPLRGMLVLSADELTAHLELGHADHSDTVDMGIDTILQLKSESLTVEGPASRFIANFQYLLENPIIAIMSNILKHNIKMLKTLPRCKPHIWGEKQFLTDKPAGKESQGVPYGMHDQFKDREEEFIVNDDKDRGWEDYIFSKNDSVEIDVPINGKLRKLKLDRNENFVLSEVP